ncbi:MAG: PEP-CTERM sorting domain-containing protein [Bryobacterales bacterium]|nr:PEP-CTERM sorting domain-containing protein [Bryobacterales bacterium]
MSRILALFAVLALSVPAFGDALGFSLDSAVQSGLPGTDVIFTGTLTNLSGTDLFLTDIGYTFIAPGGLYLTPDLNFFFQNVPGVLLDGESYSDVVFMISIAAGAPKALYKGLATILGGDTPVSSGFLAAVAFQIDSSVPEPGVVGLVMAGLGVLAAARKFRTRPATAT